MPTLNEAQFISKAREFGFETEQARFLFVQLAQRPHTHTGNEIIVDPTDGETLKDYIEYMDSEEQEEAEEEE